MKLIWHQAAWDEYRTWLDTDRKAVRRINLLIRDIMRGGEGGIGKPELLRGDLSGWASRRIDAEHRLVYREVGGDIEIASCRRHYG